MAEDRLSACPGCGAAGLAVVYEQASVPAHSCLLLPTREQALAYPRGEIRLAFCEACGLLVNAAHDPALEAYSASYEETQGFSPRFQAFARSLAEELVRRHGLRGKEILEIGCGKAEFLALLCRLGGNRGVGVDPSVVPERLPDDVREAITLLPDRFDSRLAHLTADLVVCRHTLEHVAGVGEFLRLLAGAASAREGAALFVEVPDLRRILREGAFFDVYYEHCSYTSAGTLARLLRLAGLEVTLLELVYEGQYLVAEARASAGAGLFLGLEEPVEELADEVAGFSERVAATVELWRARLRKLRRAGRHAALWGSGSKAVAFLSSVEAGPELAAVVDVNPFRQGMFVAGTGHPIVAPEALRAIRPDLVVAMNPVYEAEIASMLHAVGAEAELTALA